MPLHTDNRRLKDRGLGGGTTGVSSGQFTFARQAPSNTVLPQTLTERCNEAVERACESIGEGMRPTAVGYMQSIRGEGLEDLFLQVHAKNTHRDQWKALTSSASLAQSLGELGYEDVTGFGEGLTFDEVTKKGITADRFEVVNEYRMITVRDNAKENLVRIAALSGEQFDAWADTEYFTADDAHQALFETVRPGFTAEAAKIEGLKNSASYKNLLLDRIMNADQILDYADALGEPMSVYELTLWNSKNITPDLYRDYGQRICNKFDANELSSGQLTPKELRSLSHQLSRFSYKELVEVKEKFNLDTVPASTLKALENLTQKMPFEGDLNKIDQMKVLADMGAEPEKITHFTGKLTSRRSFSVYKRVAHLINAGLNTDEAIDRYVGGARRGYVGKSTKHTDLLEVAENGVDGGYTASDMNAYFASGRDLGKLPMSSSTADFWPLGEQDRAEFAAGTGRPWPVTEAEYRAEHSVRPVGGFRPTA